MVRKFGSGDVIITALMLTVCMTTLYPIWYTVIYSFNEGADSIKGPFYWLPRVFTLDNYKAVFVDSTILRSFAVSVARTVIATPIHVFFTAMVAYALSKKETIGRKIYLTMGTITLFVSGGLIPSFILMKNLGLINKFSVYIWPTMFSFFDALIFMNYFRTIPESIEESAKIDGTNEIVMFIKIIIPLATPVIAVIMLFNGVYNWNDYFMGAIYMTTNNNLQPIQTYLYKIVATTQTYNNIANLPSSIKANVITPQSIRAATMLVTTLPIIIVYPFLQKYFTKGLLLGAIKG
jgi:putative aldouronate transport system permease protein